MKKVVTVLLIFLMVFSLGSCGGTSDKAENTADTDQKDPISFVIGTVEPEDSATGKAMTALEKYIEENTSGAVDVKVIHNGELGGEREILESVQMGTVQLCVPGTTQFVSYDPKFGILDVPFLFPTLEANQAAWNGELGEIYKGWLKEIGYTCYGIVPVGGFRGLSNNVREVHTPEDLKGLKIRVMEAKNYVDTFNLLGANAVTISYGEVYTALQQGTIDGQDNAPQFTVVTGFYELQPYYTRLNHVHSREAYITSTKYMESLEPDIRQVIEDGIEIVLKQHGEESIKTDEEFVQQMVEAGVKVTYLTDEEMALFREKLKPLWDEYRSIVGDEIFDLALSYSK